MAGELRPGDRLVLERRVVEEDTPRFLREQGIHVLSTPRMIAYMEEAARRLAEKGLEENQTTVGYHVDVYHKAPAPLGSVVRYEAVLLERDGRRLLFRVRAWLGDKLVGIGLHERVIVDRDAFAAKTRGATG